MMKICLSVKRLVKQFEKINLKPSLPEVRIKF